MNDNQNHMVQNGRTTSRVLAPPGGQSSFSLGVAAPPPKKVAPKANKYTHTQEPAEVVAVPAAVKKDLPVDGTLPSTAPPAQVQAQAQKEVLPTESQAQSNVLPTESLLPSSTAPISSAPISNNAFASGANMNGAQVMTGRSSSRVLAPPGGHTSWTLG